MRYGAHLRRKPWLALVAGLVLVIAQLGVITHPLHLAATKADTSCSFCIGGTHWGPANAEPLALPLPQSVAAAVITARSVWTPASLVSPRSSRGPPAPRNTHV